MTKKEIIILGEGQLAFEIADQIINSDEFAFGGFITENNSKLPAKYGNHNLGTDSSVLIKMKPDVCIALNYHKIIPEEILDKVKIINSHGGILPQNRGYHASGWGFINLETHLGYSLHLMDKGTDSGPVIYTFKFKMNYDTTFNELKEAIYTDQKKNILKIVRGFIKGNIPAKPQRIKFPKYFGKRNISDCYIDWNQSSEYINNFIRALTIPSGPGAFTVYKSKKLIILNSQIYECEDYQEITGHVLHKVNERALVKTGDKCLWLEDVIFEDKKMKAGKLFKNTGIRLGINITEEILKQKKIIQ